MASRHIAPPCAHSNGTTSPGSLAALVIMGILDNLDPRARAVALRDLVNGVDAADMAVEDLEPEEDNQSDDEGFGENHLSVRPVYGVDQTRGPVNEREATLLHFRKKHMEVAHA